MSSPDNAELEDALQTLLEEIDVPKSRYDSARASYEAIGTWLDDPNGTLHAYAPEIYPQGSFNLGTVIKPLNDEEYDVDVVCELRKPPLSISQEKLKEIVGERLKLKEVYKQMLSPPEGGRRCWTLRYADERQFHVDVLPAVPAGNGAIFITDKANWPSGQEWPRSNPRGYAEWFFTRMVSYEQIEKRADVQDIKEFRKKTVLQRLVQLLKRHRDVSFPEEPDKPISIIISTMVAHAYKGEKRVSDALIAIVPRMRELLLTWRRGETWWIQNPVDTSENFADKWAESPRKCELFFEWLTLLERQHSEITGQRVAFADYLTESFGARDASVAVKKIAARHDARIEKTAAIDAAGISDLVSLMPGHRQAPPWPMGLGRHRVTIKAQWKFNDSWHNFASNVSHVPRGAKLRYIATTDAAKPFRIHWQIVNNGRDARTANQMRGGFNPPPDDNPTTFVREEHAEYRGRHWVEAFVVQNGLCVARSGEFIVNIVGTGGRPQ